MSKPAMTREQYLAAIKLLPADWYQRQHVESLAADLERAERERDEARALLEEATGMRTDAPSFVRAFSLWCMKADAALADAPAARKGEE